jgi:hypothetical protein
MKKSFLRRSIIGLAALSFSNIVLASNGFDSPKETYTPNDFKVYIDKPTGFAYVKTPNGWLFVRKVTQQ